MENNLYKLILKRRSIRLFKQKKVPLSIIKKIINAARLAPSCANLQFIEYLVIDDLRLKEEVFSTLRFGYYVYPKRVPQDNFKPNFYIIVLINKNKSKEPNLRDIGLALENILLSLVSFNLGGCIIQNIDKEKLYKILDLKDNYQIDCVVACGYAAEKPKLETKSDDVKYWVDRKNILHVPKRPLKDIFHYNKI